VIDVLLFLPHPFGQMYQAIQSFLCLFEPKKATINCILIGKRILSPSRIYQEIVHNQNS
jgi:hypothetical protein